MHVRMNREGFWDREHSMEKPKGTTRILFLGDSFTIGYGVGDNSRFSGRIEAALPERFETINMGMWGYSTGQELLVLRELGLAYDPDMVVLAVFLDDLFCSRLFSVNEGLYQKPRYELTHKGKMRLQNVPVPNNHGPSRFWNFVVTRFFDLRNRLEVGEAAWRSGWFSVFDRAYAKQQGYTLSLVLLGRIQDLCSSEGIDLLVAIIPYKDQLAAKAIHQSGRPYLGIPSDRLDLFLPQKVIKAFCRMRGIEYLDLLPIMEKQTDPNGLFFRRDIHWTERGHEVAGEAILKKLQTMDNFEMNVP